MDVLKSLRPLVIALIPGQQRSLDELKSMRVQLSKELMEISEEYGPKVFDDFNEVRFADLVRLLIVLSEWICRTEYSCRPPALHHRVRKTVFEDAKRTYRTGFLTILW